MPSQTPTRDDAKKASPLAWKSSSGAIQNPPAHNAYATTRQPANPVRHAAIYASTISSQTDLHARQPNAIRICLSLMAARSIDDLRSQKFVGKNKSKNK